MPKVSILVPICNVEKFLDKCLSSIVNQTLKDIEIICINDGSKDSSIEIIKRFALQDSRIVVIDKPNSGYGDSMNKGLDIATGEYIGIVESDDFAEKEMFEELYSLGIAHNADVVKSNFNMYWEKPEKIVFLDNLKVKQIVVNGDVKEKLFWGMPAIWSAIYKKRFLDDNNIRFLNTPGASYQDTSFKFKTTALADKIVLTPNAYLNYRQDNINSSVKNASREKVLMVHKEYKEIIAFVKLHKLDKLKIVCYTQMLQGYLWNYKRLAKDDKKWYFHYSRNELMEYENDWVVDRNILANDIGNVAYSFFMNGKKKSFDFAMWLNKRKKLFVNSYRKYVKKD